MENRGVVQIRSQIADRKNGIAGWWRRSRTNCLASIILINVLVVPCSLPLFLHKKVISRWAFHFDFNMIHSLLPCVCFFQTYNIYIYLFIFLFSSFAKNQFFRWYNYATIYICYGAALGIVVAIPIDVACMFSTLHFHLFIFLTFFKLLKL